jgi:prophage antirepressor-like protein
MNNLVPSTIEVLDADCQELEFQCHALRLTGTIDTLKWIAEDVCIALGLSNTDLSKVPEEFKSLVSVCVDRNGQRLLWKELIQAVNQDGLEYLISLASKQTALQFQKWLYKEALPSICKAA